MKNSVSIKSQVLDYLKKFNTGKTPTEIGLGIGKDYNSASSSVNMPLKKLKEEGLVEKIKIDGKVLYKFIRKKNEKGKLDN